MYQEQLKITKDRVPILIGKNGEIKKRIESRTNTKLTIDSNEGDIFIKGEDSYGVYIARIVITAIGRGFNPDIALMLTNENVILEIINIKEYSRGSKNREIITKARIIGTKGKSKQLLESLTNTDICVYGKTVSVIGRVENAEMARKALEMLLKGSKHGNVYSWIERQNQHNRYEKDFIDTQNFQN